MKNEHKYNQTDRQFQHKQSFISRLKPAFTLAEVLITLAVVGVIASLTIPSLITNIQNRETVAKVKKAYSTLDGAFQSAQLKGEDIEFSSTSSTNLLNCFLTELAVLKNCGTAQGCLPDVIYKRVSGANLYNYDSNLLTAKARLNDGSSISAYYTGSGCNSHDMSAIPTSRYYNGCGSVTIDINGDAGPNQAGRDLFIFAITKNGVYPFGANDAELTDKCTNAGWGCTAKVLAENAVNY